MQLNNLLQQQRLVDTVQVPTGLLAQHSLRLPTANKIFFYIHKFFITVPTLLLKSFKKSNYKFIFYFWVIRFGTVCCSYNKCLAFVFRFPTGLWVLDGSPWPPTVWFTSTRQPLGSNTTYLLYLCLVPVPLVLAVNGTKYWYLTLLLLHLNVVDRYLGNKKYSDEISEWQTASSILTL